jgi:DNA mismatch repair protein MutS2
LGQAQAEFEATLASIRETRASTEDALARAAATEERARAARHEAEEERRHARREREQALADARVEAQQQLAQVQAEIAAARELLERQTLTEQLLEQSTARLTELIGEQPAGETPVPAAAGPVSVGQYARSASGWQGTIEAIDAEKGEATLVAGSMRINVPLAELSPGAAPREDVLRAPPAEHRAPRAVPSSLDLRGARVEEALESLETYLDQAAVAGAARLTVIHGHGSGALRDALRTRLSSHPLVKSWRPGERGEGGDGATIVEL